MEIEDEKETKLTGWGSWAGIGIEKKNISEEEKAKKKQLEIVILYLNFFLNINHIRKK